MAWRFVKQPNGLLARFSEVVDDFTHLHMTEEEAVEYCRETQGMNPYDAAVKVAGGVCDGPTWPHRVNRGDGLDRWREALDTVRAIHGDALARERAEEGSADPKEQS